MALMVLAAHVMPNTFRLLDPEACVSVNFTPNEVEQEKQMEKIGHVHDLLIWSSNITMNLYLCFFEAVPYPPHMEIPYPPPDLT